jgi:hypothetical protein
MPLGAAPGRGKPRPTRRRLEVHRAHRRQLGSQFRLQKPCTGIKGLGAAARQRDRGKPGTTAGAANDGRRTLPVRPILLVSMKSPQRSSKSATSGQGCSPPFQPPVCPNLIAEEARKKRRQARTVTHVPTKGFPRRLIDSRPCVAPAPRGSAGSSQTSGALSSSLRFFLVSLSATLRF